MAIIVLLAAVTETSLLSSRTALARAEVEAATPTQYHAFVPVSLRRGLVSEVEAQNIGQATATYINVDFYPGDGSFVTLTASRPNVGAGRSATFSVPASFLPGFSGVADVYSDQPVAAVAFRGAASGLASVEYTRSFNLSDTHDILAFPFVANSLEGTYNTRLTIINPFVSQSTEASCIQVVYSFVPGAGNVGFLGRPELVDNGPGSSICPVGYTVPSHGTLVFTPDGDDGSLPLPPGTRNSLLSARVVVLSGPPVSGDVEAYLSDGSGKLASYHGFGFGPSGPGKAGSDLGSNVIIPLALKTTDGYYTQILMSNPNDEAADVSIEYRDGSHTYPVIVKIPARGVSNHSVYTDDAVPVGFVGSAVITSSSPIAAVLFRAKMTTAFSFVDEPVYTATNGFAVAPASGTAKTVFAPLVARRLGANGSYVGENTWISVSVVGGGMANVTLKLGGNGGACGLTSHEISRQVAGSFIFYQNAESDNGFDQTPSCFHGGATIISDVPIAVVVGDTDDRSVGDTEDMYPGLLPYVLE